FLKKVPSPAPPPSKTFKKMDKVSCKSTKKFAQALSIHPFLKFFEGGAGESFCSQKFPPQIPLNLHNLKENNHAMEYHTRRTRD
ncbi:MAG: hypothetical protein ACI4V1_03550, partial [Eubacteriales bacterium]